MPDNPRLHKKAIAMTRLFAVLIGINSYKDHGFTPLRGAVPDALEFKRYLVERLNVPTSQITLLTNEHATRANIIHVLKRLRYDRRIVKGDAIFLYYAGHGAEIDPPKHRDFEAGKKIQAIVPYDYEIDERFGKPVSALPDYVLGILLSKIAETKGDNITVIFDSCYSASGTRGTSSGTDEIARSVELPSNVYSEQLDQELLELDTVSRGTYTPSTFPQGGLGSHILLAACGAKQTAWEKGRRGRFSVALLELFNRFSPDMLTYSDILDHLRLDPIPGQDPQCEGLHTNRKLFNAKILPIQRRKSFRILPGKFPGEYVVNAGDIHNIPIHSIFEVYRMSDINFERRLSVLYVAELQPFRLTVKLLPDSPILDFNHSNVAVQTRSGMPIRLRIHIPPQDGFYEIYANLLKNPNLKHYFDDIALVDKSSDSTVEITLHAKDEVKFKIDTIVRDQLTPIVRVANSTDLVWILSKMAHFYWELRPRYVNARIWKYVDIGFYELKAESRTNEDTGYEDIIFKQVDSRSNLYIDGIIELPAYDEMDSDEAKPYGIQLINRSSLSLYANVFNFTSHDLSISAWVKSHHGCTTKGPDVPLGPQGGSLEIGFDPTAGHSPRSFRISNGLDTEVGWLKIYLSTESVNLAYLEQSSPFTLSRSMMFEYKPKPVVTWADILIPIVLRRYRTASTRRG